MRPSLKIALASIVLALTGCHNVPKDSYLKGLKSTVNTPWGPSTLVIEEGATGKAALEAAKDIVVLRRVDPAVLNAPDR